MPSLVGALLGITVATPDPEGAAQALESALGWRRRDVTPPGEARGLLIHAPGAERGMIRLTEGPAVPAVRGLAAGWASAEIVVRDVDGLAARLASRADFELMAPPATFDLTELGSNVHRGMICWGPGGLQLGLTQALTQPRGRRFAETGGDSGPIFSVGLRAPDLESASAPYRDRLGMETLLEVAWTEGTWHRMLGIPAGETASLRLLKGAGEGTGLGTIEIQQCPPEVLRPPEPNPLALVTYHALDLVAVRAAAEPGSMVVDEPGRVVLRGSQGELLELVERPW